MPDQLFRAIPGFAALLTPTEETKAAGVSVAERDGLGLATILAREGQETALRERLRKLYGAEPPAGPSFASAGPVGFIGTAPGAWLALHEERANDFAGELSQDLAGLASVSDQSDGYAVLRLAGPKLRDALSKGFTIDLHQNSFGPGAAAVTAAAHIGAILWRPDDPGLRDVFELALFRSYAASFWHWLEASVAEYGCAVRRRLESAPR